MPKINPCDFCGLRSAGHCNRKFRLKCQRRHYFWCGLPENGCGFNNDHENCYGFRNCPNVKLFLQGVKIDPKTGNFILNTKKTIIKKLDKI